MSSEALPPTPPSEPYNETGKMSSEGRALGPSAKAAPPPRAAHKHIWVITGPAGCGKTSVAEHLHQTYSLPYLEGDTYHTPENVAKMAAGHPLTDADRWDWLITLRETAIAALENSRGVIVTCSALKRKYRDVMRIASYHHPEVRVNFVFLKATEALLMDRVRARQNHYMKDYMVHSQFESLEAPMADETDVLPVEAAGTPVEVQELAETVVQEVMEKDTQKA